MLGRNLQTSESESLATACCTQQKPDYRIRAAHVAFASPPVDTGPHSRI